MNKELQSATAQRINELHQTVLDSVKGASEQVNAAMMASVEIGGHIGEISRGQRMAWLRDNCPNIDQKQIAAYLSIAATYRKRPENAIDHRFFALLGMIDEKTTEDTHTKLSSITTPWIAWTGKLVGHFRQFTKTMPVNQWQDSEKEAVAAQLKPIVELYNVITK
jgi:hypothetical protein